MANNLYVKKVFDQNFDQFVGKNYFSVKNLLGVKISLLLSAPVLFGSKKCKSRDFRRNQHN